MDFSHSENQNDAAQDRVAALAQYGILDTPPEPEFDDIVLLATRICETPVGLVSLVTNDRQWFKARLGFPECETPLSQSVCAHALLEDGILVIPDLTLDARTRGNSLVTQDPFIRFYAGAVLKTPGGVPIGSLCVIDTVARPAGLSDVQADSLQALARQVMAQLELRRYIFDREAALIDAAGADLLFRQHQRMLKDERQHRLKNVVAVMQGIVLQTLRHSQSIVDAKAAISSRLRALVKGQEILFQDSSENTTMLPLVESIAELYQTNDHLFDVGGPDIEVGAKAALAISLIINELATNATKYGSLSGLRGTVAIHWEVDQNGFTLSWRESGGPAVVPPTRRGFGTTLIERAVPGSVTSLRYLATGLAFRLSVPMDRLCER